MQGTCPHCGGDHDSSLKYCPTTGKLLSPERLLPSGTMLEGKYRVGKPLGVGGIGAVFEATHVLLGKRVAVKLLLPEYAKDKEMTARLVREARAASATGHRNIVAVTDMGHTEDGSLFLVMEYVAGRTLRQVIAEEAPLPIPRAVGIAVQMLGALEVVHRKGIVHRDLKPANLLVFIDEDGDETIKILDFGISKITSDPQVISHLTTAGRVMGTPKYMSPEQAIGDSGVDHRADIYTGATILYELLTGAPPFTAPNYNAMIALLLQGTIDPPSTRASAIPRQLDQVVLTALRRAPEQRYPDAAAFRRALEPFLEWDLEKTRRGVGPAGHAALGSASPSAHGFAGEVISFCGVDKEELLEPASAPRVANPPRPEPAVRPQPGARADVGVPVELEEQAAEPLELADPPRAAPSSAPAADETLYRPAARRGTGWLRWAAAAVVLVVVVVLAWRYRGAFFGGPGTGAPDTVMLLVKTEPERAEVYVDGVLAVTRPIQLPRSERMFTVRVQARGYHSEVVQVPADRTRVFTVKLRRKRRRR